MARKQREEQPPPEMEKPPYKVGDIVTVTFLGTQYQAKLTALKKNAERWVYSAEDVRNGTKYVQVGYNGSEKYSNIWDRPKENFEILKENLDSSKE